MIRQRLGDRTFNNYVPANSTDAQAFADALLPGEYEVFELVGESGTDNVTGGYKKYTVMIKDETTYKSTYLTIVVPISKSSTEIRNALIGKTFNGVKADRVIVLNEREVGIVDTTSSGGGNP